MFSVPGRSDESPGSGCSCCGRLAVGPRAPDDAKPSEESSDPESDPDQTNTSQTVDEFTFTVTEILYLTQAVKCFDYEHLLSQKKRE